MFTRIKMSGECDQCGEHALDCIHTNKKSYTCGSCGLLNPKVEARGIWHCPNALCQGSGGAWFRRTLKSYRDISASQHTVDEKEWRKKGREYNSKNKIPRQSFRRMKEKIEETPETQKMKWISVEDRLPDPMQDVYVKTDCEDCPILNAIYYKGFHFTVIMQCEKHYETDQKFLFIRNIGENESQEYAERITHWMPLPKPPVTIE